MYRSFTAADYRKHFGLPTDYSIDGILCAGSIYSHEENGQLKAGLKAINRPYTLHQIAVTGKNNQDFLRFIKELHIGNKKLWYFCIYGGALLSEYLHFGYLFGAKKTILVGMCGGLNQQANVGDIIIPDKAHSDGSTAHMYDREHQELQPSDKSLSAELEKVCQAHGLNVHRGKTMTCQAMIAETWEDVQTWSKAGYLGVEMEAATVFAVSSHFEKPAAILSVADNLIKQETNLHEKYHAAEEHRLEVKQAQYQIAIKILLND